MQNHYTTKPKRRQKSGKRKDWTQETALKLRSPEAQALDDCHFEDLMAIRMWVRNDSLACQDRRAAKTKAATPWRTQ